MSAADPGLGDGLSSYPDALDGIGLFDCLDPDLRQRLITAARPRHHARGTPLYREGDASDELLLLMSGVVVLFRSTDEGRRALLAAVRPPSTVGDEALAGDVPRLMSAEASQDSFALAVPKSELASLIRLHPAMGTAAQRWLALHLERLAEQRADDVLLDLPGRVAKALLRLTVRDSLGPPVVELNQGTLAALARGSRQRVNRALREFAAYGWVSIGRAEVVVTDPDALAWVATQSAIGR